MDTVEHDPPIKIRTTSIVHRKMYPRRYLNMTHAPVSSCLIQYGGILQVDERYCKLQARS